MMIKEIEKKIKKVSSKKRAEKNQYFFKTGKGEYGYGDIFIGVSSPDLRKIAKGYLSLNYKDIKKLLNSKIHEYRLLSLMILVENFKKSKKNEKKKAEIYNFYIKQFKHINNWDLVDVSCHYIVGGYLFDKNKDILIDWAQSEHLWTRRISIVCTWWFIRNGHTKTTFLLAKKLLSDDEDLMHKAVGWMLREAGKKDLKVLESFLDKNIKKMPRTMLRYSIEKFPETKRKYYLNK